MGVLIVVSELRQLTPPDRWPRLVSPLSEKLDNAGLGRVLELDSLRCEAERFGRIEAEEVSVELNHFGYGRELVDRVVAAAGLSRSELTTPVRWLDFCCDGINWGYRRGNSGLWAWYPIDAEFRYLAPTTEALLDGWFSGSINM